MPLARYKTFVDNTPLSAADLNGIQDQVITNQDSIGTPRTSPYDMDGQRLILSADGATSLISSTPNKVDVRLSGVDLVDLDATALASVNGISIIASPTGQKPAVAAKGLDADVGLSLRAKGTAGAVAVNVNGFDALTVTPGAGTAVNGMEVVSAATGVAPELRASGADANVNVRLVPKGTGNVTVASGNGYAVDGTTANTWRAAGVGTSYVIQENIGTPSAPVWVTRTDFVTGAGISSSLQDANNQLDNGALNIWQNGAVSGNSTTATFPDRWLSMLVSTNFNFSRQTLGASGFRYLQRIQRVAAATDTVTVPFYQAIPTEAAQLLAGQQVTFSFYARAGANYSGAAGALVSRIHTGTGTDEGSLAMIGFFAGPWLGAVQQDQTHTLTTSLQRFTHTVTLAANTMEAGVELRFVPTGTAGASDYYEVTGLLLQLGPSPGTYPHASFAEELARCQRFYCKTFAYGVRPAVNAGFAGTISQGRSASNLEPYQRWQFPVEMHRAPAISRANPGSAGAADQWRNNGDTTSSAAAQTLHVTSTSAIITNTGTTLAGTSSWHLHLTADASL